ncbi:MAG: sulfite exporter TauE/SafE family protein [Candidatus Gygaella obscura]|nr:sulfite exporter TauE/SafE family protein [Candidatus Gygaella obscura]
MIDTIMLLFLNGVFFGSVLCVASCGPLVLSYVTASKRNSHESFKVWSLFSLGRIIITTILGLIAGLFGQFVIQKLYSGIIIDILFVAAGIFIFVMGLIMIFEERLHFDICKKFHSHFINTHKKASILMGVIVGILPCAPLLGVLLYIALVSKNFIQGGIYAFSFSLGTFFSPLMLLVVLAGTLPKIMAKKPKTYLIFRRICGIIICYLGLNLIISIMV